MVALPRCKLRWAVPGSALVFAIVFATAAAAHPNYESGPRVIKDNDGRSLHLFYSFSDGIFFKDSVKLIVRDTEDQTIAETPYGGDLSVICWPSQPCLVFHYDGIIAPVIPTKIWRLEDRQLREARSVPLIVLGMVAPLWEHALEYVIGFVMLAAPFFVLWGLSRSRPSRSRTVLLVTLGLAAVPYLCIWLYTALLLSYLSLPLMIAVCAIGTGILVITRRVTGRAGISHAALSRLARVAAVVVITLAGLTILLLVVVGVRIASYTTGLAFDDVPVREPLKEAHLTRVRGVTKEALLTVMDGTRLEDVVNLDLFDGFDAAMTREDAERRVGPPTGRWTDPAHRAQAFYYDRPGGRVSLVRHGGSHWSTVGYPTLCTHEYVFRDPRLRQQVLQWLPPQDAVQVNVRSVGSGGLTVFLNRTACTSLVLTARKSEAERPNPVESAHPDGAGASR